MPDIQHGHTWTQTQSGHACETCTARITNAQLITNLPTTVAGAGHKSASFADALNQAWKKAGN